MMESSSQIVKFLNVGHGDSSVIYLMENSTIQNTIVVDIPQSSKLLDELRQNDVKTIDLLVITHSDSDHCKGVNDFLERYINVGQIKNICFNIDRHKPTRTMKLFLTKFLEYYKRFKFELIGGENDTGILERKVLESKESSFSIVYPNKEDSTITYMNNNINDMSIVCMLKNNDFNILFSGDLGLKGWKRLIARNPNLHCQILKMPHHGAYYEKDKASKKFEDILEDLGTEVAIISTGHNSKYNHPDKKTIQALVDKDIRVYCTQYTSLCSEDIGNGGNACSGDIIVIKNKDSYEVKEEVGNKYLLSRSACIS